LDFNTLVSGTALPYLNVSDLRKIPVVHPSSEILAAFETAVSDMFSMMHIHAEQSLILTAIRDALLPKLLSGDVDVSGILGE
jgi:type I restriction enzyme S subunit